MEIVHRQKSGVHAESGCRGAAIVEFALVVALLFAVFSSAFDCGQMLRDHSILSQASYEGARAASFVVGLSKSATVTGKPTDKELASCGRTLQNPAADPELPCALILANYRALHVLELSGESFTPESYSSTARFDGEGHVTVEVTMNPRVVFPLFRFVTLHADMRLPYIVPPAGAPTTEEHGR